VTKTQRKTETIFSWNYLKPSISPYIMCFSKFSV